jgi:hypothetical protein
MAVLLIASWLGASAAALAQQVPTAAAPAGGAAPAAATLPPPMPPVVPPGLMPPWCGPACPPPPPPDNPCCDQDNCCAPKPTLFHFEAEYLLWFTSKQKLGPLVTSGPLTDPVPGALGQPHTTVVVSGETGDRNVQNGIRLNAGLGLDNAEEFSLLGSFFILQQTSGQHVVGGGSRGDPTQPVIARPFFNVNAHLPDADPVVVPGIASGFVSVDTPRVLYGADVNLRYNYYFEQASRLVFMLGGRYLALDEGLNITELSRDIPGLGVPGNVYTLGEHWRTRNRFYGGQVGSEYSFRVGPLTMDLTGKLALGPTKRALDTSSGIQIVEANGIVSTNANNALYISPLNAGHFSRTSLAFVPEAAFKLNFDFNEHIRLSAGYSVLYISDVIRPADQVDQNVVVQPVGAPALIPPPAALPRLHSGSFWAHGLDAGLRISF